MKMQNLINSIYLMIISLITLGSGCDKISYPKSSIGVANNTNHNIEFYFSVGGKGGILYPDTTLPLSLEPPFQVVKAGEIGYRDFGFSQEELFEQLPSDTLSVYLFHPDTLAKYDWKAILGDYNILKRYDLSLGDLERLDYTITYPPDTSMEGVKMWPP